MAAVIQGHRDPFGKKLSEYTTAQLDFVLEMAAVDEPERWVFQRGGEDRKAHAESLAKWRDALAGRALMEVLNLSGATAARAGIAAWKSRRMGGSGMRPGLTRGGRKV
jgi:hypothetical protein